MNILFTVWGMSYGGAERFVLNVVKELDKKNKIIVFSDNQKKGPLQEEFEKAGAKVYYAKVHRFKHPLKYMKQLKGIIKKEKIEIIHSNDDLNMVFPLAVKPREASFVAHSHSTKFRFTKGRFLSLIARKVLPPYISTHSDVRLCCGDDAGRAMFGRKDYVVIRNGINTGDFEYSKKVRKELREKYGIDKDAVVMLNVGRLSKEKNQAFLIEVFKEYYNLHANSYLVMVGDGPERDELKRIVLDSKASQRVIMLPSQNDISRYYNMADVFLLPSVFEGMPTVSVEAQTNGLKCVFSDAVTKEADFSGRSTFLPLDLGAKEWAKRLSKMDLTRFQCDYGKISEYDVGNCLRRLNNIYVELLHEENA